MNPIQPTAAAQTDEELYPSADGKPMAETQVHLGLLFRLFLMIEQFFAQRQDVNVGANQLLYYQEGDPKKCTTPDIYVLKGVNKLPKRHSIKTWVEKTAPCFVLELTSQSTATEDWQDKKQIYQSIGVVEYFVYDPLNEAGAQPLLGFSLVKGKYQPLIPNEDGGLFSDQLQLKFVPDGENLKVFHFRDAKPLLSPTDYYDLAKLAEQKQRIAEQRVAELTAELERLRAQLPPPPEP